MSSTATPADVLAGNARWCVVEGDAAEVLRTLPDGVATAVVTDPPSGIAFMGAEWDRDKGGRAQWVAWLAGILAEARRCTRDGGRSVVWSLPRTSHWTGCAVEDAGWSVENTITHLFGTGWPKGSSQLKPAAETWWLARTGRSTGLSVDACRVRTDEKRAAVFSGAKGARQAEFGAGTVLGNSGKYLSEPHDGGRYPPNVVLSHSSGCVRVGTRRVATGTAVQRNGGGQRLFNTPNRRGAAPDAGYADADGTEAVEAWECAEPTRLRVPLFAAGTLRPSGPSHEPESLPGLLRYALRGWSVCSTSDTCPSLRAASPDDIERIRSVEASADSAGAAVRALGLSGLRDFQDGYRFSLRSDDERVREVAAAFRASSRRLFDVLCLVCSDLFAPLHTPTNPHGAHPSSSSASPASETARSTRESRTSATRRSRATSGETPSSTAGTSSAEPHRAARPDSTSASSTSPPSDTTETACGIGRTESDEILLVSWCLYVLSVASSETVARQWIDINLGGCPVAELDAQSGERTSGAWDGHRNRAKTLNAYGEFAVRDEKPRAADTGTASRFFPCFPADPAVFRYVAKPSSAEKGAGATASDHPTVKSISLMKWLIDLVTQRDDLVIDPFGGSGTTACAALASGRRVILVERDPHFAEIARQRCAHWGAEWDAPARASKRKAPRVADAGPQGDLFAARTEPAK